MGGLLSLLFVGLVYLMMRFGCGAHMVHGGRGDGGHAGHSGEAHATHTGQAVEAQDPLPRETHNMKGSSSVLAMVILIVGCAMVILACNRETPSVEQGGTAWGLGSFSSNGERIYFTATDTSGQSIGYSGGPSVGMMMGGGRIACASCHGPGGRGGTHMMQMQSMKAPDVRWSTLVGMQEEGHESGEGHEHSSQGYDLETFRRAVVKGEHPDGDKLKQDMPRWDMSEANLRDLMNYLKTLQ